MSEEVESKRPAPSTDLLEKIRVLRIERERISAEISVLSERLKELGIKIGAYEDAAAMVFGESQYVALMAAIEGNIQARRPVLGGLIAVGKDFIEGAKKKNLSEGWAKLLVSMSEHASFGYDDLEAMSDIMDHGISKAGLRSQIKSYVDSNLVERIEGERGRFRVTEMGRITAEAALPKAAVRTPAKPALPESPAFPEPPDFGVFLEFEDLLGDDPSSGSGGSKNIFE